MSIQAEVSLYPLRTQELAGPIEMFCQALARSGLRVERGPMSARVAGDCASVFTGLGRAFAQVAEASQVVLVAKVSNSCPGG